MTADLNLFQNVGKSVSAKALGKKKRVKMAANQVRLDHLIALGEKLFSWQDRRLY